MMTYQVACEGITDAAIVATAKAYVQGRVSGHNRAFAPSCAEFAETARKTAHDMAPVVPALPEPKAREVTPEYRAAMGHWLNAVTHTWGWEDQAAARAHIERVKAENPLPPMYADEPSAETIQ